MALQLLRIDTKKSLPSKLVDHIEAREGSRPEEALTREEWDDRAGYDLGGDRAGAVAAVKEARAKKSKQGGRPAHACVMFVCGGPPPFEAADAWPKERVVAWAEATHAWIRKTVGPEAVIAAASLHADERSPHIHAAVVPIIRPEIGGDKRMSWSAVRTVAAYKASGEMTRDSRKQMAALQDDYHRDVGAKFGLGRGEKGAVKYRHEPKRAEGLKARIRDTERLAQERIAAAEREAAEKVAAAEKAARGRAEAAEVEAQRRVETAELEARQRAESAERAAQERSQAAKAEAADAVRRAERAEQTAEREKRRRSAVKSQLDRAKSEAAGRLSRTGADDRERRRAAAKTRVQPDRFQKPDRGGGHGR